MVIFVTILHVLISIALIVLVLLHSGKGGGLSDMFGSGGVSAAAGSTAIEKNLDRMTIAVGTIFAFTTTALALML